MNVAEFRPLIARLGHQARLAVSVIFVCACVFACGCDQRASLRDAARKHEEFMFQLTLFDLLFASGNTEIPPSEGTAPESAVRSWRFERYVTVMGVPSEMYALDEPWNSAKHEQLRSSKPIGVTWGTTNAAAMMGVIGEHAAFRKRSTVPLKSLPRDQVLVVSVRQSSIHWMEPVDIELNATGFELPQSVRLGTLYDEESFLVCFRDGAVWRLRSTVPPDLLARFMSTDDVKQCNRDRDLATYCLSKRNPLVVGD